MKLLALDINQAGIQKFRIVDPHVEISKTCPDIEVHFGGEENFKKNDFDFDVLFVHNSIATNPMMYAKLMRAVKGKKLIVDVDDYWELDASHYLYHKFKSEGISSKIVELIKKADLVTTTTKYLAEKIRTFNKNCAVIPNSINRFEKQFWHSAEQSDRFRFGMATGSSHLEDVKLLRSMLSKVQLQNKDIQFVLGGFDIRVKDDEGNMRMSYDTTVWKEYEKVLTNNFMDISPEYTAFLKAAIPNKEYEGIKDEIYRRIWTRPIQQYGTIYNAMDVAIAPLKVTKFNAFKSELKIIEAGFHGIPIVCSDLPMYSDVIKNGENSFLIEDKKSHKDFAKYLNVLAKKPELREQMGAKLREDCILKFDLATNTAKRAEIYRTLN